MFNYTAIDHIRYSGINLFLSIKNSTEVLGKLQNKTLLNGFRKLTPEKNVMSIVFSSLMSK